MYGSASFIGICALSLATVLAGIFLCKKSAGFVFISLSASAFLLGYVAFLTSRSSIMTEYMQNEGLSVVLLYVLPALVFFLTAIVLARWGIRRRSVKPKKTGKASAAAARRSSETQSWLTAKLASRVDLIVFIIAGVVLLIHLVYINSPPTPMGDESYYVKEASRILNGQALVTLEHPPLGKWLIAAGGFIFGQNGFGMRIFSMVFGAASILLFYYLCRALVQRSGLEPALKRVASVSRWEVWFQPAIFIPLFAVFLFATENMSFVQGHLATLDAFALPFMLSGFLLYLKRRCAYCGLVLGLGLLCKETVIFGALVILIHWVLTAGSEIAGEFRFMKNSLAQNPQRTDEPSQILAMAEMLAVMAITFIVLLPPLEYVRTSYWGDPIDRMLYMLMSVSRNTNFGIPGSWTYATPWMWLIRPDLQYYNSVSEIPRYFVTIGWTVWPLIIPAVLYLGFEAIKGRKHHRDIFLFPFIWFAALFGVLALIEIYNRRPMYTFYLYPAMPAVCLGIALAAWRIWESAAISVRAKGVYLFTISSYAIGTVFSFVVMSPLGSFLFR
jgi:hypothetical protein